MSRKYLTHLDLAKNELQNAVIQNLASDPSSPVDGQIYYHTGDDVIYVRANGAWVSLQDTGSGATNLAATLSATNTIITSDTGTDATIPAADTTNAGVMTKAMFDKLTGIEASADVTDAANVDAAGAVMNSDTSTAAMSFVVDEDNMASDSATKVPTQQSTKAYVDAAVTGLLDFKGSTDASSNPNYPAASKGDTYVISVAGKIGGASGKSVDIGDMYVATANNAGGTEASVGTSWSVLEHNLVGAMLSANNLSDVASAATAFANIKQAATAAATGVVELATQAEAETQTDTSRAVTPEGLANYALRYTATIGDNSATQIDVTHNLGTKEVITQVRQASDDAVVECDITNFSTTVVRLNFAVAPATNAIKVVVMG